MSVTIDGVVVGSLAARKGIAAGDILLAIDGYPIDDVLDYRYAIAAPSVRLTLRTAKGCRIVTLRKGDADDIGLTFATYLMDSHRRCRNNCIFCFIDQLPPGMRESLYFKDDDDRLSFLFGNYITLTNLRDKDIDRIIRMRIAPVRVSVHATEPALRRAMLGNRRAGAVMDILRRFADAGLPLHIQLVLCPGVNDGQALAHTVADLLTLRPALESVAAVPVGLTRFRDGLPPLRRFTQAEAGAVIDLLEGANRSCGGGLLAPADEFYLLAQRPIPPVSFYGDFHQIENGVGMTALVLSEFSAELEAYPDSDICADLILATGTAFAPFLRMMVDECRKKWHNIKADVLPVVNRFFGETITVAGLVTGGDLCDQLSGRRADAVLFPRTMLRREGDVFLDDVAPADIAAAVGMPLIPIDPDGASLAAALYARVKPVASD